MRSMAEAGASDFIKVPELIKRSASRDKQCGGAEQGFIAWPMLADQSDCDLLMRL